MKAINVILLLKLFKMFDFFTVHGFCITGSGTLLTVIRNNSHVQSCIKIYCEFQIQMVVGHFPSDIF